MHVFFNYCKIQPLLEATSIKLGQLFLFLMMLYVTNSKEHKANRSCLLVLNVFHPTKMKKCENKAQKCSTYSRTNWHWFVNHAFWWYPDLLKTLPFPVSMWKVLIIAPMKRSIQNGQIWRTVSAKSKELNSTEGKLSQLSRDCWLSFGLQGKLNLLNLSVNRKSTYQKKMDSLGGKRNHTSY